MCMEDVRLGRERYARLSLVTLVAATAGQVLLGADPKRVTVSISSVDGSVIWISDKPMSATATGYRVAPANAESADWRVEDHGDFVTNQIFAWSDAGATVAVVEVSLGKD